MAEFQAVADDQVKALRSALRGSDRDFLLVGTLIRGILLHGLWKNRYVEQLQKDVEFSHFLEFVTEPPPAGLGTTVRALKRFCRAAGDTQAVIEIDKAIRRKRGAPKGNRNAAKEKTNNDASLFVFSSEQGNSYAYAVHRLKSVEVGRADLAEQVEAGEISAAAALREAGVGKQEVRFKRDPALAAAAIRRHFTPEEVAQIVSLLQ